MGNSHHFGGYVDQVINIKLLVSINKICTDPKNSEKYKLTLVSKKSMDA